MTAKEFLLGLPQTVTPDQAEGVDTLFHFDLAGDNGGQFSIKAKDGVVTATEGFVGDAKCIITARDVNFMGVINGDLNPMMAVLTGKVKISNQEELIKYAKMFGMM